MKHLTDVYNIINPFVKRLKLKKEVIGICLLGGLSRGNLDKYSDIDLAVLIDVMPNNQYLPPFSFHVPISKQKLIEFNLSQLFLPNEKLQVWDMPKIEAYINAKIIYDTNDIFKDLIVEKTYTEHLIKKKLITNINQYYWKVQRHAFSSKERGFDFSSNLLLIDGVYLLLDSIFLLNNRLTPHTKWIESELNSLHKKPDNIMSMLNESFNDIFDFNVKNIHKKIIHLNIIYDWLCREFNKKYNLDYIQYYDYWAKYISNRQIYQSTFADKFVNEYKDILNLDEIELLKGQISYFLCSSYEDIIENVNEFKISKKIKNLIKIGNNL